MISLLLLLCYFSSCSDAWFVTPPTTTKDWQQLACLVVQTFDAPPDDASPIERLKWNLMERGVMEEATYRQYVRTARKMKQTKYAILVAKQWGNVIGMAELGVNLDNDTGDRRATIGVLCVDDTVRKQGVGKELVTKCCQLAVEVWNETILYAEVEPSNDGARTFFQVSCGFEHKDDAQVMVNLRTRGKRRVDQRPHLLLRYNLTQAQTYDLSLMIENKNERGAL
jgi:ribosomal protein S18 acetylase RimI-like enzyme